jgi:hypothetical protein
MENSKTHRQRNGKEPPVGKNCETILYGVLFIGPGILITSEFFKNQQDRNCSGLIQIINSASLTVNNNNSSSSSNNNTNTNNC